MTGATVGDVAPGSLEEPGAAYRVQQAQAVDEHKARGAGELAPGRRPHRCI
ncbi:hypothetical protein L1785_22570 [Antribacter sp. KLBMP9083]|uniref:Uncharacterized protein n=1 Tax=Antribacter soli TaxID=2910976 RepID=A0AA41U999_9MICO|nr:hypothetical protein [Antribacter soli]MCF4123748.1 hypothetical protein [Antribacter soli]